MKRKRVLIVIVTILAFSYLITWAILNNQWKTAHETKQARLEKIANTFGVPHSWDEIVEYTDCQILAQGNPREEIFQQLGTIGDLHYLHTSPNSVEFHFQGYVHSFFGVIHLTFDDNNQLVGKFRRYDLGDPREMFCP